MLGIRGWFSTNILGNRDGEVLDDPGQLQVEGGLQARRARVHPAAEDLPRALRQHLSTRSASSITRRAATRRRAGTTSISSAGSATRCRSRSTSSAATRSSRRRIVLDLALFMDLAQRAGFSGIQEWLSFYFKSPMTAPGLYPEHDLFIQSMKLKNTLRWMMGEELITHLGQRVLRLNSCSSSCPCTYSYSCTYSCSCPPYSGKGTAFTQVLVPRAMRRSHQPIAQALHRDPDHPRGLRVEARRSHPGDRVDLEHRDRIRDRRHRPPRSRPATDRGTRARGAQRALSPALSQ